MRTKRFRLLTVFLTVVMLIALSLKVYIDDTLVQESTRFYYKNEKGEGTAKTNINVLRINSLSSAAGTIYIDDVKISK